MPDPPRIIALDIETSPLVSYTWGIYEQDVIKRLKTFTILSVAYQWLGQKTKVIARDNLTEKQLLAKLYKLLDQADVVIAHNGDAFDIKKINARFITYKIYPPSPYKTIDTKKEAKKVAAFDSNSLNNLGIDLGEGEKIKHRGFDMWEGCMAGNRRDWRDMKRYNKKDVDLLVRIYYRLRPWMKTHPDIRPSYSGNCPKCDSTNVKKGGVRRNKKLFYQRLYCLGCGGWFIGDRVQKDC